MLAPLLLAVAVVNPGAPAARCTLQQVHTPAGKMVHAAPILRCDRQEARVTGRRPLAAGGPERAR